MSGAANAASPCIGVCRMTADGYCAGCRRSLGEIARWGSMHDAERAAVYEELAKRDPLRSPESAGRPA